uniref:putative heat shock 70 kDa protein 7 n=1 Tax=Styela clava TaxID=7725 RepID=UPI00193953ED|nr:putative heat shock 70 kDa protein 7 [Styela clava]
MSKDIAIGIDFGTNFVCAGALVNGKVEIIPNEHENRLTPAYVAFTDDERLFGESAKHQAPINPDNTFYNVKQLAGRLADDPVVNNIQIMVGYPITGNEAHQIKIPTLHPEQVIAMIIERMRKLSESHLNASVKRAVISVPSSFSNAQRQATLNAGEIAGFEDIKLISDSAAAALAYAFDGQANQEKKIIILDFGGGSLDISLATIHGPLIQIVWSYGDCSLGGESIDYELTQHFGKEFNIKTAEKRNLIRLKNSCEKLKRNLSVAFHAHLAIGTNYVTNRKVDEPTSMKLPVLSVIQSESGSLTQKETTFPQILEDIPKSPFIACIGNTVATAETFYVIAEREVVCSCRSFFEAVAFQFASFYVFNIEYPNKASLTFDFIQRFFGDINPSGTKSKKSKGKDVNAKVIGLARRVNLSQALYVPLLEIDV